MVAQANEANGATDETPAKAMPLSAPRLAFRMRWNTDCVPVMFIENVSQFANGARF